jgi:hypothetical protein
VLSPLSQPAFGEDGEVQRVFHGKPGPAAPRRSRPCLAMP